MTKARGAADSIGKVGREASFLLPAFSPYYVPYFPLFLRARAYTTHTHTIPLPHTYASTHSYVCIYTHIVVFSFLFVSPSSPSTFCSILLRPRRRSPSASLFLFLYLSLSVIPPPSSPPLVAIVRMCVYFSRMRLCVCTCTPRLNRRARFHVARLYAPAARGRLCTWVNGKMSFETFLGRSRSPHCQSYTRAIPLLRSSRRSLTRKRSPLSRSFSH